MILNMPSTEVQIPGGHPKEDQWLQLKLDKKATFSSFEAGFSRGGRNYEFSVLTSMNGKEWKEIPRASPGKGNQVVKYETL